MIDEKIVNDLFTSVGNFTKIVNDLGLSDNISVEIEKTRGIIVKMGDKKIVVSGTIDQLWLNAQSGADWLTDAKTSKFAYAEYVIQMSLYQLLLRAAGKNVSEVSSLFMASGNSSHAIVNIDSLSDEELFEYLKDAVAVLECKEPEKRWELIMGLNQKWNHVLNLHRHFGLDVAGSIGSNGVADTHFLIGGSTFGEWLKGLNNEFRLTTAEENLLFMYSKFGNGMDYEEFLHKAYKEGVPTTEGNKWKLSASMYKEHLAFRNARAQYFAETLQTFDNSSRAKIEEIVKSIKYDDPRNMVGDYLNAINGKFGMALKSDAISSYNSAYGVNQGTYNYSGLGFSKEDEDMIIDPDKLANAISSAVATAIANTISGGSTVSSSSGGGVAGAPGITDVPLALAGGSNSAILKAYKEYKINESIALLEGRPTDEFSKNADNAKNRFLQESMAMGIKKEDAEAMLSEAEQDAKQDEKFVEKKNKLLKEQKELLIDIKKLESDIAILDEKGAEGQAKANREKLNSLNAGKLSDTELRNLGFSQEEIDQFHKDTLIETNIIDAKEKANVKSIQDKQREDAKRRYLMARRQMAASNNRLLDYQMTYNTSFDKLQKIQLLESIDSEKMYQGYYNDNVTSAFKELKGQFSDQEIEEITAQAAAYDDMSASRVRTKHKGHNNLWGQLGVQMSNIMTRFTQMGAAYKIIGKIREGFNNVVQSAKNLDKAMTDLRIVTGQTGDEARQTMGQFSKLAGELGVSTSEVAASATAWLRQGYNMAQVNDLVTSSLYLSRLGMISVDEATKDMTSSLKGFKLEAQDALSVVDKLTALDVKAATTAGEIATGLAQFANLANLNGISIDQAAAMVATIADVSQVSGSQAGNSIKMMLSRYGTVKSGKFETMTEEGDDTASLNDVEKVLKRIGVSMRDSNLQFREFDEVLNDISEKWDTLDNISRNAVATALAGTRQREAFLVLMSNMDKYQKFTEVAETSEGTAQRKYVAYTEQLEASQKRLAAAWEKISQDADIARFLKNLNDIATVAVKTLPIIAKYLARWIVTTQAHKLPGAMKTLSPFLALPDTGIAGGMFKKQGFKQGIKTLFTGRLGKGAEASLYQDSQGNIIDSTVYGSLSAEEKEKYRGLTGMAQSGARGYQSSMLNLIRDIDQSVRIMAGRKGTANRQLGPTDGMESSAELADEQVSILENAHKGTNGLYYIKGRRGAMGKVDYENRLSAARKAQVQAHKEEGKQLTKQSRSMSALTIAMGTLTNVLTSSTSAVNYSKLGKASKNGASGLLEWSQGQEASGEAQILGKATTAGTSLIGGIAGAIIGKGNVQATALGTQAGGLIGDILSKYVVMPLYDREYNARQTKIETATKNLANLSSIQDSSSVLTTLSNSKIWTDEQYKQAKEASDDILKKLYSEEGEDTRVLLEKYLTKLISGQQEGNEETKSLYSVMQDYMNGSAQEREFLARQMQVAAIQAQNQSEWDALAEERHELEKEYNNKSIGQDIGWSPTDLINAGGGLALSLATPLGPFGMAIAGLVNVIADAIEVGTGEDSLYGGYSTVAYDGYDAHNLALAYEKAGFDVKHGGQTPLDRFGHWAAKFFSLGFANINDYWVDTSEMNLRDQREAFEKLYNNALESGDSALADSAREQLKKIDQINARLDQMYDKLNEGFVQEAILLARIDQDQGASANGRYISQMTNLELKELGPEKIIELVALYLQQTGKFAGHELYENGEISAYAENVIMQQLRTDSKLAGIMSGNQYKLSEVIGMEEGRYKSKYMANFAAALGITIDDLVEKYDELVARYGDLTLGALLETPAEIRQHVADAASLIKQMATSTGLMAENIETIINKFPTLVKYIDDEHGMAAQLIKNIDEYRKIYAQRMYNELKSSQDYYNEEIIPLLKESLSSEEYKQFSEEMGNANSIDALIPWLGAGGSLAAKVQKLIEEATNIKAVAEIDQIVSDTVLKTREKLLERQIDNLTQQKEALSKINEEREYENKLIEAKLKMEDAYNEKKKVWREGVGWVYESDQTALAEAQKNLDSVKNEKKISELDLEIERLKAEKEYLEKIPEEEELKNMMVIYEEWTSAQTDATNSVYALVTALKKWTESNMVNFGLLGSDVATNATNRAEAKAKLEQLYNQAYTDASGKTYSLDYLHAHRNDSVEAQNRYNAALSEYQKWYNDYKSAGLVDEHTVGYAGGSGSNITFNETSGFGSGGSYYAATNTGDWTAVTPNFYYNIGKKNTIFKRMEPMFWSDEEWTDLLKKGNKGKYRLVRFDPATGLAGPEIKDQNWQQWKDGPQTVPSGMAIMDKDYNIKYVFEGGTAYNVISLKAPNNTKDLPYKRFNSLIASDVEWLEASGYVPPEGQGHYSAGSLSTRGGLSLINELGTEAIITPQGTITSLPSGSGVVPADVTRNVWQLGELAPSILRALGYPVAGASGTPVGTINNSDSVNIGNIQMTVNPNGTWDVNKFVEELKQKASLSKNNKR